MSVACRVAGAVRKPSPKPSKEKEKEEAAKKRAAQCSAPSRAVPSMLLRRAELLRRRGGLEGSVLSLNVSLASVASDDSFCSRASTGRIGRPAVVRRRPVGASGCPPSRPAAGRKAGSVAPEGVHGPSAAEVGPLDGDTATARCPWVTPNTDPCYAAFHDEEWGVPVHDDKNLFEMLVLSGALAEMTWPAILSKRDTFREVFMGFDPLLLSRLKEKKLVAPGNPARSLLSEQRLRMIIGNARESLKVIEEFGSLARYFWGFVGGKPVVGRFRYGRQVPAKTPKAEAVSRDMMRKGFRGVGPTVVYSFMQAVGMANDHLVTCFRFRQCCSAGGHGSESSRKAHKVQDMSKVCPLVESFCLEPSTTTGTGVVNIS